MNEAAGSVALLLYLSLAVERAVELLLAALPLRSRDQRRAVALATSCVVAFTLCFVLELDLVGTLLTTDSLTSEQGTALTAIAVAAGSAPAHELLRLLEDLRAGRIPRP